MIPDAFNWLVRCYFWGLTGLYHRAASSVRYHFTSDMSVQDVAGRRNHVPELPDDITPSPHAGAEASHGGNSPRANVLEDVSAAEDAHQIIISTKGDLIIAKKVSATGRARQWIGQMDDVSLQQLSGDQGIGPADAASAGTRAMDPETERAVNFVRYGPGNRLEGGAVGTHLT